MASELELQVFAESRFEAILKVEDYLKDRYGFYRIEWLEDLVSVENGKWSCVVVVYEYHDLKTRRLQ